MGITLLDECIGVGATLFLTVGGKKIDGIRRHLVE
jgi:hypothetical protein